jgi:hypothetical protein
MPWKAIDVAHNATPRKSGSLRAASMTLLKSTPHLTTTDADRRIGQTHVGQAHFAGTGPDGAKCGACVHFDPQRAGRGGIFKQGPTGCCIQYTNLMRRRGPAFSATAAACRHFKVRS